MAVFKLDLTPLPTALRERIEQTIGPGEAYLREDSIEDAKREVAQLLGIPFALLSGTAVTEVTSIRELPTGTRLIPRNDPILLGNRIEAAVAAGAPPPPGFGGRIIPSQEVNPPPPFGPVQPSSGNAPSLPIGPSGTPIDPATAATIGGQTDQGAPIGGEGEGFFPFGPQIPGSVPPAPVPVDPRNAPAGLGPSGSTPTPAPFTPVTPSGNPEDALGEGAEGAVDNGVEIDEDSYSTLVKSLIADIIDPKTTQEELLAIVQSPEFKALLADPENGLLEIIGIDAFNNLARLAEVQTTAQADIAIETLRQNPFGRTGEEDAALQALLARGGMTQEQVLSMELTAARAGINNPYALLATGKITPGTLINLERIAASGGLSNEADILAVKQAIARGPIDNPFALFSQTGNIDDVKTILEAQNAPQLNQQFLDFIGNPSAVGSAVGFGFNPFQNRPQQQAASPIAQAPVQQSSPAIPGRGGTGPDADPRGPATPNNPFQQNNVASSDRLAQQQNDPFTTIFNDPSFQIQHLPFESLGSFRGAGANPGGNELRDRSDEELQFLGGQAASRGETPSALGRRVRSNTAQGV